MSDTDSLSPLAWIFVLTVALYLRSFFAWRMRSGGVPLPPGPKAWPFIGNLPQVPRSKPWIGYRDLCSVYGDIVYVRLLSQPIVVLGNPEVISECLDKSSAITSDRPQSPLIRLIGCGQNFGLLPYGRLWRHHRSLFSQYFSSGVIWKYQDVQRAAAHKFLARLLKSPARFKEHIRHNFSSALLKIVYDIDAADEDDPYIAQIDVALEGIAQGLVPGKYLVELVPALSYVPSWFPGTGWQKLFSKWRAAQEGLRRALFAHVKEEPTAGCSVVSELLESMERTGFAGSTRKEEEEVIQSLGSVTFEAGADTTLSTFQAVFVAMTLYPEVLKKAQAELDSVVGLTRLPDFSDQPALVYVNAIIKEALRWHNVVPLCIPHSLSEDDEFHGYFMPKGTVILPNIWACMRDPEAYGDPDEFRPEQFIRNGQLDPSVRDPAKICPGRYIAEASLFINVASVLHTFDIAPPLDEHGRPVKIVPGMTDGLLSYPQDVRCTIKPRSPWAEALIRRYVEEF
ncbi:cytochrome P450 [Lentinus tigrinus ALCF2SS1-6]|uniref:Cytochrome P450 n=1 Tax=Lentinus tigrinus ALCF2SS1-6 TaxID=1328759 RepID=A0A5C2SEN9_9APHY|nr:cytochrome P450 [Lentinus tigrinus ALCF2SS1-6]